MKFYFKSLRWPRQNAVIPITVLHLDSNPENNLESSDEIEDAIEPNAIAIVSTQAQCNKNTGYMVHSFELQQNNHLVEVDIN